MRIAFVGKGGSGKTTLSALFSRHLARSGAPVLAVDGDINQHLAEALGHDGDEALDAPPLGAHVADIKDFLRGTNPRIASREAMIKTTPPGRGSRLLRLLGDDELHARHVRRVGDVPLMVTGEFEESDLGVACYHSKLGGVELYLNHLVDGPGEYVVVDMTAGADAFASGLFTRFDLTFLVAEPTRKGVSVYHQYRDHAREFGIRIAVVGNKVTGEDDLLFLKDHVGDDLLTHLVQSTWVRAAEQGCPEGDLESLEPHNRHALSLLRETVDAHPRDWAALHRHAVEFHLRNARSWANEAIGLDLTSQVDPDFVPGPAALV
ncbi:MULTISPECIES: ATP-binding protein [Streptomyces]|uniref:ATP-binding protein n=1 Tax=Streptomyces sviceus (strain ATCC 29083 / DSM 924 / JCM 4929 / NBRC 13980 / NCIMB 11184 / NRRL 5439 / UC 5370) TaxID=463191 RepID=D6XB53_STRX2|nr:MULTISPECIES: ATP-binding protein [Streptomyces]EFH29002.1 ATP-binding protein [Streptomyces sviceus ATCC 29083]MYT09632.1 ATP-binding protein [Streptomyces sp. SID5470]